MDKRIASITGNQLQKIKELEEKISKENHSKIAIIAYSFEGEVSVSAGQKIHN